MLTNEKFSAQFISAEAIKLVLTRTLMSAEQYTGNRGSPTKGDNCNSRRALCWRDSHNITFIFFLFKISFPKKTKVQKSRTMLEPHSQIAKVFFLENMKLNKIKESLYKKK